MRKMALDMVLELARRDPRVVFMGSDLGAGVMDGFKAEWPERFFMEGISEAHLVGMAAGLALEGKIVYLNTIATFLTRRCFEQIVLDLCLHQAKVRLIASGGGVVYAPLGPTHEAIEDLAILRALPGMTVLAPADATEMARLMPLTLDHPGPIYLRLGKGGDPVITDPGQPFRIGRLFPLKPGRDLLLVTTGTTGKVALDAAALLDAEGLRTGVLHVPTLKPLDAEGLLAAMAPCPAVVTLEEHVRTGGLGSAVAEVLAEAGWTAPKRFLRLGLPDAFPSRYGSQASLMAHFGLTPEGVAGRCLALSRPSAGLRSSP
jgi:transketolase